MTSYYPPPPPSASIPLAAPTDYSPNPPPPASIPLAAPPDYSTNPPPPPLASIPLAAPPDDPTNPPPPPPPSPLSAPTPTPTYTSSTPPAPPTDYHPSPPDPPPPPSSGPSVGIIVGIVAGAVAFVLLFSILFIGYRRRKNKNKKRNDDQGPQDEASKNNGSSPSSNERPVMPEPQPSPPAPWRPLIKISPRSVTRKNKSAASKSNNSSGGEISNPVPPPAAAANPSPLRITIGFSKDEFTYEELAQATDGFCDANVLGQGGFGCVHKGLLPDGKEVAIKQLKAGSSQGEREFQAEVEIISRVHHRHLVSLVGYCITGTHRLLVYEFVPNNTLEFHLHGKGRPTMEWPTRLRIALGAAKGLAYLHEDCHPKIIHRDIKAANILLDFKFEAKVADFGLAKFSPDVNTHVSTRVMGTFGYLAPEYASSGKLTEKSDVFSFGVMLLELITGRRPVDSSHTIVQGSLVDWARPLLTRALEDGNFDPLVDPRLQNEYDPNEMARMVEFAAASIQHSAKRRPRMSQIVRALEGEDLNDGIRPGQMALGSGEVSGPPRDWSSGERLQRQTTGSEREPGMSKTNNTHGGTY